MLLFLLLDPKSNGIYGSMTHIEIKGNKVILEPSMTMSDNPEDYAIEIDRDELIRLAREWDALIIKKVPQIFIYCKNDTYFVSDTLPEDVKNDPRNKKHAYVKLELEGDYYWFKMYSKEKLLNVIANLFHNQGSSDVTWLQNKFLDTNNQEIWHTVTRVLIENNKVILKPLLTSDSYEIDRDDFLRLTNEWQALVNKKSPQIFVYSKDGTYFVSDTLPEGIE